MVIIPVWDDGIERYISHLDQKKAAPINQIQLTGLLVLALLKDKLNILLP